MIAGSFASTYHGLPRTTHDIDIVIDPTHSSLEVLLSFLPEDDYYVDEDRARKALQRRTQFNIIDMATAWRVDCIIRKTRPFNEAEFERRQKARMLGVDIYIATPEDTIISKLEWSKKGQSERQLRDVQGIVDVVGQGRLDLDYIERWVATLKLQAQWSMLRSSPDVD